MATSENFDVLLLDVMLPSINGIEICRRIRTQSQVPILLLTARDAVMDRVAGLDAGLMTISSNLLRLKSRWLGYGRFYVVSRQSRQAVNLYAYGILK